MAWMNETEESIRIQKTREAELRRQAAEDNKYDHLSNDEVFKRANEQLIKPEIEKHTNRFQLDVARFIANNPSYIDNAWNRTQLWGGLLEYLRLSNRPLFDPEMQRHGKQVAAWQYDDLQRVGDCLGEGGLLQLRDGTRWERVTPTEAELRAMPTTAIAELSAPEQEEPPRGVMGRGPRVIWI